MPSARNPSSRSPNSGGSGGPSPGGTPGGRRNHQSGPAYSPKLASRASTRSHSSQSRQGGPPGVRHATRANVSVRPPMYNEELQSEWSPHDGRAWMYERFAPEVIPKAPGQATSTSRNGSTLKWNESMVSP